MHIINSLVATTKATAIATTDKARVRSSSPQIINKPSKVSSNNPLRDCTNHLRRKSTETTRRRIIRLRMACSKTTVTIKNNVLINNLTSSWDTEKSLTQPIADSIIATPPFLVFYFLQFRLIQKKLQTPKL